MYEIYLDYAATTPTRKEVLETFVGATQRYFGNSHSLHKYGAEANRLMESARKQIASYLFVSAKEIYFTSGATEGNNMAIKGIASTYAGRGKHIVTTSIEHASVFNPCRYLETIGYEVTYLGVDETGKISLDELKSSLRNDTILVSVMHVNSEMGAIEPVEEIGEILKDYPKTFFHVDATQSIGKIDLDIKNIDLLTFSAHKIGGLQSSGFIYVKEGVTFEPLFHGGSHERNLRGGTQSVALAASVAKAVRLAIETKASRYQSVSEIHNQLYSAIDAMDDVVINTPLGASPYILNVSVMDLKPETVLHALEEYGIYISTKSACSSRATNISRVIDELTHDEKRASTSIRFSFYEALSQKEINYIIESFQAVVKQLRGINK